jgi:hypothetical protein
MESAGGDRPYAREVRDPDRPRPVRAREGGAVAELFVVVVAPGFDRSVVEQCQGVLGEGVGGDSLDPREVLDSDGYIPAGGGAAVPELAVVIVTPGPDRSVLHQREAEFVARGDRLRARTEAGHLHRHIAVAA